MNKSQILDLLTRNAAETLDMDTEDIDPTLDLRELVGPMGELGGASVDSADILLTTMESLEVNVPLSEFASARNLEDMASLLYSKVQA